MKLLIFAGGAGTRLWPISRKNAPKQFETLKEDSSTLQMAIRRIENFGMDQVYISTNQNYKQIVERQIPHLDSTHIFVEPCKRDLAAAVGLAFFRLKAQGMSGPVAILWADHFMEHVDAFQEALIRANKLIIEDPKRFIFLAETPRFANENLGWMKLGKKNEQGEHAFLEWRYRPEKKVCKKMFASGDWYWNPGYFITDIDFVIGLYQMYQPKMAQALAQMANDEAYLEEHYASLPSLSFDEAIIEKLSPEQASVLPVNLGWSDPGTLYALKEAFEPSTDQNFTKGNTFDLDSKDCFVYNEEDHKIISTIGLDGMMVINTKDALLVCHKDDVGRIKMLLKDMESEGLEEYL